MSEELIEQIPEDIREHEALKGMDSVEVMSRALVENHGKKTMPADWRELLPEELRKEKSLESFKDVAGLGKSFVETKKMVGNAIQLPEEGKEPGEGQLDGIYDKLGRPKTAEEYKFTKPDIPDGIPWDETMEKSFLARAHKAGLSNGQVETLMQWHGEEIRRQWGVGQEHLAESVDELKGEWGANFDRNIALAQRAVVWVGGEELKGLLESTGLANNPIFVRAYAKQGKALAEDGLIESEVSGVPGLEDAKTKITEYLADRKGPYWNKQNPAHVQVSEEVRKLYKVAYPGQVAPE
ncbi:hypothetical protein LCGC14_1141110 [marine sediment metagenome]|uniref:Uncharacterized protein n=1 Tax=marine sediment metagenome TaxID=412755 RepID=A0A0F9Q3Z6_9ZZZZ